MEGKNSRDFQPYVYKISVEAPRSSTSVDTSMEIMWFIFAALIGVIVAQEMTNEQNDRTLFVRSLPGYPGMRSNLYEVYMEPYYFAIDTKAVVEMKALSDEGMPMDGPRGILTLQQMPNGVRIMGSITGLSQGMHGFHVHDKGDLRKGCASAGPHFNPYMTMHGSPKDPLRHVGDLGNIEANADGIAEIDIMDHYMTLNGVRGAIGRALVVHEKPDDLGRGGTEDSMKTGSSGARLACGVVGFM